MKTLSMGWFRFLALLAVCSFPAFGAVIKAGMTLNIIVKNDPQLSQIVKVQENGTLEYPLYQDVSVIDKTTSELQDILTFRLARVIESPLVLVSIVTEVPLQIYVLGQVPKPGMVSVSPRASLQEVLQAAGGPSEHADLEKVKVVHRNQGDESASYYNLQKFLTVGDLALLPTLRDGDRIIVLASKSSKYVKVLGAVSKPGFYTLNESASVFDMLYLAGGPSADANLTKVRVMGQRGGQSADFMLDLQRFIDEGGTEKLPLLSQGDVIIVYNKTLTWSKSLTVLRDIVTIVTAWFVISRLLD